MSFEPNYEKIVSNYKRRIGEMQTQIECKLPITNENTASKVLVADIMINSINGTAIQNMINLEGVAKAQVIYEADSNNFQSMDYTIEFKDKFINDNEINANEIMVQADIIDVSYSIDGNMIRITGVANIIIDGIFSDNVNALVGASNEGMFAKMEQINYSSFLGTMNEKFDVSNDYTIQDSVNQILNICPTAYIDKVEANDNFVKIYGYINVTTTYSTMGEMPTIRTNNTMFDFTQEVALTGVNPNSKIDSFIRIMYSNIIANTNIEADVTAITLNIPMEYIGYVWNDNTLDVVSDIFSTTNLVTANTTSFNTLNQYEPFVTREHISGAITLQENDAIIDEILGVSCASAVIANTNINDDKLTVDGVAYINVLYRNNDLNSTMSYMVQLPFSIDLKVPNLNNDMSVNVVAKLSQIQAKARRGVEIEVTSDIILYITFYETAEEAVIDSIAIGEEKPIADCNLSIYFAKENDTIWDIAKKLSVSEDIILSQNPDLTLPVSAGEKIVVYRQSYAKI